jgi:elongation factor G
MGDITSGLATKRARINGTDSMRGGELIVKAQVPLAEISEYSNELKAVTAGRGRYAIELSHYEAVPGNVQRQLVEAYKPRHEEE